MHFFFDWDANFLLSEPKGTEEGLKNHHRHLIGFILFVLCRVPVGTRKYPRYQAMFILHYEQSCILYQVTRLGEVLSRNAVPIVGKKHAKLRTIIIASLSGCFSAEAGGDVNKVAVGLPF